MKNSKISWTHHTFNPWIGCTKVSPGCAHCYAASMDHRWGHDSWGAGKPRRRTAPANWKQPLVWDREAAEKSQLFSGMPWFKHPAEPRPRVFCASLADWLDKEIPLGWFQDLLRLIHGTPNLDWLLLTKRPENFSDRMWEARENFRDASDVMHEDDEDYSYEMADWLWGWLQNGNPPANVWIGTSVEDQPRADERIPHLLKIPSKVRFLSMEPLLGPVDLAEACGGAAVSVRLDWVIVGGESGTHARPMHPDWARSIRDQCKAAGVPFHFKQWGEWRTFLPEDGPPRESKHAIDERWGIIRVGKHAAGRLLDGAEHDSFPVSSTA